MNRRNLLKSAASVATGAVLLSSDPEGVSGAGTKNVASTDKLDPFVETHDGTKLFCKDWSPKSSEKAKPVLFVHSWALNSDMWQYQMVHLASHGLRCLAYDQRGHGRSSQPGYGYDYHTLAADLAAVIEHFGLHDVTLVGHSIGCGEIVRYLSRHGSSRVARVAFIGTATPFALKTPDNPDGQERAIFDKFRAACLKDFPKWLGENARPFFVPETSPEMVQWVVGLCLQASLKALMDCNVAVTETDLRAELRSHRRSCSGHSRRCGRFRARRNPRAKNRATDTQQPIQSIRRRPPRSNVHPHGPPKLRPPSLHQRLASPCTRPRRSSRGRFGTFPYS
jgi:non-heme chloroperoxidase